MKLFFFLLVSAALASVHAFAPSPSTRTRPLFVASAAKKSPLLSSPVNNNDERNVAEPPKDSPSSPSWERLGAAVTTTLITIAAPLAAQAVEPDWGLFEGRTASLIHPVMMGGLFLYSAYTAFLGFQWRRQRTMGDDIAQLKKQLPAVPEGSSVAEAVLAAQEAGDSARVEQLQASEATQAEIATLQQERKELAAWGPRDKHFAQGALLAFLGTTTAIEGCLNTFGRAGKLFPGPHLYAGAALVVLWGLAVSTVPAMQKGSETARKIHIGANLCSLGFFAWQVQTGIPIMLKVIEKTSWP